MKVIAQKRVNLNLNLDQMVEEIKATIASLQQACSCEGSCDCPASWVRGTVEAGVTLSCYGERVQVVQEPGCVSVLYVTCSGNYHAVEFYDDGWVIATSNGRRNSDGWGMAYLSDTLYGILQTIAGDGWTLLDVETSQPEWGVYHWLAGRLKEGPSNRQEAEAA